MVSCNRANIDHTLTVIANYVTHVRNTRPKMSFRGAPGRAIGIQVRDNEESGKAGQTARLAEIMSHSNFTHTAVVR